MQAYAFPKWAPDANCRTGWQPRRLYQRTVGSVDREVPDRGSLRSAGVCWWKNASYEMTNLQRRLVRLEALLTDSTGLVPHSEEWLDYWRRWLFKRNEDPNSRPSEQMPPDSD